MSEENDLNMSDLTIFFLHKTISVLTNRYNSSARSNRPCTKFILQISIGTNLQPMIILYCVS